MNALGTRCSPATADTVWATVRPPRGLLVNRGRTGTLEAAEDLAGVRRMLAGGSYLAAQVPSAVAYRMERGEHRQTGIVAEVPVEAYADGRIRGHEATHPARERRLAEIARTTGTESVPVVLAHSPRDGLRSLLAEVTATPPVTQTTSSGDVHTAWVCRDAELAARIYGELGGLGTLYVADGHHRLGAAAAYARNDTHGPPAATLAALFPSDELTILGYHRCVTRPPGLSPADLRDALAAQPTVERVQPCATAEDARPEPGVVAVYLAGQWFRAWLRPPAEPVNVRAGLDVVALDEGILGPVFGIADVQAHADATALAGGGTPADIAAWCDEHDAIGFLPHPPTVGQVLAVSDAGLLLPPKSTWFAPKAHPGLFVRQLA